MKKIIIILWAMLFSFCTWAQGSERLRDHQIPATLEGFFKYADSLGYRANVHYIQRETRKVSVSFSHFVRKDENVALLLDSARHTFHTLADEAQETFFWESHKDGVDSVEYALHLDKGNLKFTYKPCSLVYLDFMYQVDSIKHPITEKIDKRGYWKMLKEVLKDYDNVNVDHFSGLLADYVNRSGFDVVVRGLRNTTDFDYEMQMAQVNDRLFNDSTETVFLMADPRYSFISSSVVREVSSLGGNIEGLVPEEILKRMVK